MWALVPVVATTLPPLLRDGEGDRPTLSGPEQIVDDGLFRIHYTREGGDAADDDLLDAILAGLQHGRQEFEAEGWRPLRADDGTGGTTAIDVYVQDIDIFGYATPVTAPDGSWSCFLQIDSGATVPGRVAESVALHELHHCVEFRYTVTTAPWLLESAATYEQYSHVRDPLLDVALGVLYDTRLADPTRKLSSTEGRDEYAAFLWMKFWSELGGSHPERLPLLWEELAGHDDWAAGLDAAARARFDRDLADLFVEHATWNSFACAADDGAHYRGDVLPCIAEVAAPVEAWDGTALEVVHDDGPYTASFFEAEVSGSAEVELACDGTDGLRVGLVQVRDGRRVESATGLAEATLTMRAGDVARAVIAGTGDEPLDATCTLTELPPGSRKGCSHSPGAWAWLALVPAVFARRRG